MKKVVAITLVILVLLSSAICSVSVFSASSGVTLTYSFSGGEAAKPGFAEGTISLKVTSSSAAGNYYLYWADAKSALSGYREVATLNVSNGSTGTYKMFDHTAIPPKATQLIAIKSSSAPSDKTVAKAAATFAIPASKRLTSSEPIYTFGAYSDTQIANDSYGSDSYPNDETHWAKALETFANRDVDFLVSSGDIVNDQNGGVTYAQEYQVYQKILAESSYANPVWEANGNHDVHVNWKSGTAQLNKPFVMGTGVDSKASTIKANTPYFEMTEPTTGDHFIFMALEGGFYTNTGTQFSTAQLNWLEGLLKKYSSDGKNIFILEHANIEGNGSGDKTSSPYYYDLGMKATQTGTSKFLELMKKYKECVVISGHTHLELGAHLNFSDNNGTSAAMIHNSAIGGVRQLKNGSIDRKAVLGLTEGYLVDVYKDCIILNGTNLYYNEIMPDCSYILPFGTSVEETEATEPTNPPTKPTEKPTNPPTTKPTDAPATKPTNPPTTPSTVKPTNSSYVKYGDVNLDYNVGIIDATVIQQYVAEILELYDEQLVNGDVDADGSVSVLDATYIQLLVAELIDCLPADKLQKNVASVSAGSVATLLATVKKDLSTYYQYSSFDQYMALKKVVKELEKSGDTSAASYDKLNAAYTDFNDILDAVGVAKGDTIDVYFTNIPNWTTVNAYAWGDSGNNAKWPGTKMSLVETNDMGQTVYKITLETGKYTNIIFNNGTTQTVDLSLSNINNEGFYTTTLSGGKYLCSTYIYGE